MHLWRVLILLLIAFSLTYPQNHLLISEIQVAPEAQEFIEIFNPNPFTVDLDSFYLSDYNTYYQLVTGTFSSDPADFLVKFPAGARIDSGGVVVVARDGSGFSAAADFEILGNNPAVTDMVPLYVGSSAALSNFEMVILFYWDGYSDLVSDVDYAMWGTTTASFIDKSGISIDGPDPGNIPSLYRDDTPVTAQLHFPSAPISGKSISRTSVTESGERMMNGNGLTGHDETSEPVSQNFILLDIPSPGSTSLEIPTGNGSGLARIAPDSVRIDSTVTLSVTFSGTYPQDLTDISLTIADGWVWSGSSGDIQLSGPGFTAAGFSINGPVITLNNAQVSPQDSGVISIANLTAPSQAEVSTFEVRTAISGGTLTPVSRSPQVTVWAPVAITPIAEIQANPGAFTSVTIEGIVVLGAGITATSWTDAYVQDNSGAGINIYRSGTVDPDLLRGNRVRITGMVIVYQGVTEITDYSIQVISTGNPLPAPLVLSTQEATSIDWEGTFIEVSGEVTDFAQNVGGGTNIRLNDGSGECLIRVWNTTGINLSGISLGVQLLVRGPLDIYQGATQLLLAYQEDLNILQSQPGDGSGTASVSPDSVGINQSNVQLTFDITGESAYTLESISVNVHSGWQWSGSAGDVTLQGTGFSGSQVSVTGNTITVNQAAVTAAAPGRLVIRDLISPASDTYSTFMVRTATVGGVLTAISTPPRVKVGEGITAIPIADIQRNTSQYLGQQVTIMGVVVLGAGITTTSWTDAYVQDNSGYGINIYQGGTVDTRLVRGNQVLITGQVDEYTGTTEIVNYTLEILGQNVALPQPLQLFTSELNDVQWEGIFIQVTGVISDIYAAGGGTTISVDDGSGEGDLRVWDTAGLNVTGFSLGDTVTARGPLDIYSGTGQLLVGYREDLFKPGQSGAAGDGSGFALLDRDSIPGGLSDMSLTLSLWSVPQDTLRTVQIWLPVYWGWTGLSTDVQIAGRGLAAAGKKVVSQYGENYLELSNCAITEADSGYVTINRLSAPFQSVYAYFWVKTAVTGGIPRFIENSPYLMVGTDPVYIVRDLQVNSSQFREPVNIRGVVTVGSGVLRTDRTSAYLQDESGYGININQSGAPDARFQRGFYIELLGSVSEYRQTTQLTPQQVAILDSSAELPDPMLTSTREANDPRWDGTLVRVPRNVGKEFAVVTDKYTTSTGAPYDYNIVVNDGSGPLMLRVWGTTGINLDSVLINDAVIATGIGSVFLRDNTPEYQILPAYQEDIVRDLSYVPSLQSVSLDVSPHPFVPDRGEKIQIRYNAGSINNRITIRIFDLGGRQVTTLLDESAQLISNMLEWDGRDNLLDYVPLGTYLCHLEIMEPVSGKKKTETAPIVVGTVLKK